MATKPPIELKDMVVAETTVEQGPGVSNAVKPWLEEQIAKGRRRFKIKMLRVDTIPIAEYFQLLEHIDARGLEMKSAHEGDYCVWDLTATDKTKVVVAEARGCGVCGQDVPDPCISASSSLGLDDWPGTIDKVEFFCSKECARSWLDDQ